MFGGKRETVPVTSYRHRRRVHPANVIAAVLGILSIALGIWALIRTGLNTDHIFTPTKEVLGLPHTPTLALAEIGFGILLLLAAAMGAFGTFLIAVLGAVSLAFGIIVLSDSWSHRVHRWTAASHDSGWLFILVGAVLVLTATVPLLVSRRPATTRDEELPAREPVPAERERTVERDAAVETEPARPEDPHTVSAASDSATD